MKQRVARESWRQSTGIAKKEPAGRQTSFVDNRSLAAAQRKLAHTIGQGTITQRKQMALFSGQAASYIGGKEEELLQGKFDPLQRMSDEAEALRRDRFAPSAPAQLAAQDTPQANNTGLPDQLKSGIENLSGMSMDHVKVHYNSGQPAQLNAHAYAQGSDIHVAPGQEQHVPHEAWHVVQQAQGRVKPPLQMKGGVPVNDDAGLEREADVMGARAAVAGRSVAPAPLIRDRGEQAEAHPQRKPVSGQESNVHSNFLSPIVQAKRIEKTYRESSRAGDVYKHNEWVYRHMILESVQDYFRYFVKDEWEQKKDVEEVSLSYQSYEEAVAALSREANEGGAVTDERSQRVAEAWSNAISALDALVWHLKSPQEQKWIELEQMPGIIYANPPLTESRARNILVLLEQGRASEIPLLKSNGGDFNFAGSNRKHEWGLLKDKSGRDECKLVIGDRTGVDWPKELLDCGIPLAHSHPYFKTGKTRNKFGGITTDTKEIANHANLPAGVIKWSDISSRAGADVQSEISKIFPSASDIEFSGKKQVADHTVYTPYAILNHPSFNKCITNPDLGMNGIGNAPRLVFKIVNARLADDGHNYTCTLQAEEGSAVFWTRQVTTNGLGQFGLLVWT